MHKTSGHSPDLNDSTCCLVAHERINAMTHQCTKAPTQLGGDVAGVTSIHPDICCTNLLRAVSTTSK